MDFYFIKMSIPDNIMRQIFERQTRREDYFYSSLASKLHEASIEMLRGFSDQREGIISDVLRKLEGCFLFTQNQRILEQAFAYSGERISTTGRIYFAFFGTDESLKDVASGFLACASVLAENFVGSSPVPSDVVTLDPERDAEEIREHFVDYHMVTIDPVEQPELVEQYFA